MKRAIKTYYGSYISSHKSILSLIEKNNTVLPKQKSQIFTVKVLHTKEIGHCKIVQHCALKCLINFQSKRLKKKKKNKKITSH